MDYVKLSELVDSTFTVNKVWGYSFKRWNNETKKMETSDTWQKGYSKVYQVDTDKGKLDLRAGQLGNMLESVSKNGQADLNGTAFSVKSNGKTGIDIRYYIHPAKTSEKSSNEYRLEDIPY